MPDLEDARFVARCLAEEAAPVAVIVFGSVARNGRGNDLDLLVVTERDGDDSSIRSVLKPLGNRYAIDCFPASVDVLTGAFRRGSPFLALVQKEGRLLYMKETVKEWMAFAKEDLEQAFYLLQGEFYRGSCYHAQQAAEKAVKAALLKKGWELERIRNLRRLLNIAREHGIAVHCDEEDTDFMDSVHRSRYPLEEGLLPPRTPSHEDARRATAFAEQVLKQLLESREQTSN